MAVEINRGMVVSKIENHKFPYLYNQFLCYYETHISGITQRLDKISEGSLKSLLQFKKKWPCTKTEVLSISYICFESLVSVCQHISPAAALCIWRLTELAAPRGLKTHLLHLSRSTPKQLDIPLPQDLLVLLQGVLGVLFTREKHKGIASGPSIRVLDKEQTLSIIRHWALWTEERKHFLWCRGERQPPHTDYHLVLFGQELGHFVWCTWCQKTAMVEYIAS